ncbi:hypothetical protein [Actinoalloteichus caeruleus]|uniref:Uncharacterized protein n=1 Tax=Actinoalloteichus caeruleus DSM 43889 TaxID=1120930 RepID=A0ABT1JD85_ACTCY|nr:hypothetical protein [Actinoalloteichus caeruleus]MCP2330457.1 hypothetical protein [Actinoalloteichus caeruleus DSM 43889]
MSTEREEELAVALAHMARSLLAENTVQDTLNRVVEHAVDLVDGCEHAGILTLRVGHGEDRPRQVRTLPPPMTWSGGPTGSRPSWTKAPVWTRRSTASRSTASRI